MLEEGTGPREAIANLDGPVNLRAGTNFISFCTRLSIYEQLTKAEKIYRFLSWSRNLSFSFWSDVTVSPF